MTTPDSLNVRTRRPVTDTSPPPVSDIEIVDASPRGGDQTAARYVLALTRLSLGFVFLWAFLDKLFGLGRSTPSARSWLNGGSPTTGFLDGVNGPLADQFHAIAGNTLIDWVFMVGLLGIGAALMLGIGMRIAAGSGAVMMVLMWAASLPISANPFMDEHLIYAMVLVALALLRAGNTAGLGTIWNRLDIVNRFPVLR
jgi:thiosulfate dehydrogenase [quinone] large subunit